MGGREGAPRVRVGGKRPRISVVRQIWVRRFTMGAQIASVCLALISVQQD